MWLFNIILRVFFCNGKYLYGTALILRLETPKWSSQEYYIPDTGLQEKVLNLIM